MKKCSLLFLFSLLLPFTTLIAQRNIVSQRPKLVVFLFVDELSTDQLVAFRDRFSDKGFNKLLNGGTFYRNASYPAGSVYPGSNLSTFYTGAYPATHGIVSDKWFDKTRGGEYRAVSNKINENMPDSSRTSFSTSQLLVSTFTDELKWMYNGNAKVSAICFTPSDFLWAGGHAPNGLYFLSKRTGGFELANDTSINKVSWMSEFNSKKLADLYSEREWGPRYDLKDYYQLKNFNVGLSDAHTFLYSLKKDKSSRPYAKVVSSPYGNKLMRDFVASHIINEKLGKDDVTDVLSIQFTAQTSFRPNASVFEPEIEDMLLRLDAEIADVISIVEDQVGLQNTLFVLSGVSAPLRTAADYARNKIPSGTFSGAKAASLLNLYLMAVYGQGKWVKAYYDGQIYLNHELLKQSKLSSETILEQSCDFLMEMEGVAYALSASELMSASTDLGALKSLKLTYHPRRSGDILLRLQPGWNESVNGDLVYRHWDGVQMPLVFYGWKIPRQNIGKYVNMIDVAPSICSFLEIPFPNGCEGKPLVDIIP